MIDRIPVLNAEKILFNSVLSGNLFCKPEENIQAIIGTYIKDNEIKNIMQVFNLTKTDFENIYYHIFSSFDFYNLIYLKNIPCLFATALILDYNSINTIAGRVNFVARKKYLLENAHLSAVAFFKTEAVKQNIVSVEYFCRNGVYDKLRK
ncbi:MAG: hypothetical protein IKA22_12095 [Lentisphaeria bacterium]|nr:hypothetical protein [Lentisphaeria bacterium]